MKNGSNSKIFFNGAKIMFFTDNGKYENLFKFATANKIVYEKDLSSLPYGI